MTDEIKRLKEQIECMKNCMNCKHVEFHEEGHSCSIKYNYDKPENNCIHMYQFADAKVDLWELEGKDD